MSSSKSLDAAVSAMLEMESYLLLKPTTAGAASTGISNPAETTAAAVNTENEPMTDLMKQQLERMDRMEVELRQPKQAYETTQLSKRGKFNPGRPPVICWNCN